MPVNEFLGRKFTEFLLKSNPVTDRMVSFAINILDMMDRVLIDAGNACHGASRALKMRNRIKNPKGEIIEMSEEQAQLIAEELAKDLANINDEKQDV
jgi:hypothetical protein